MNEADALLTGISRRMNMVEALAAQAVALQRPDMVDRLVMIESSDGWITVGSLLVRIECECSDCGDTIGMLDPGLPEGWRVVPGDEVEIRNDATGEVVASWCDGDRIVCPTCARRYEA